MTRSPRNGFFVCIEGLDGCGGTTQSRLLVEKLVKGGRDAVYTMEPTRGRIGGLIREYCLYGKSRAPGVVEALLFAADRFEHVQYEIIPALDKARLVVSDRYLYSSLSYQGSAGLSIDWIRKINAHAIRPDLAIFIDVDPEVAVQRLKTRKSIMETLENQRRVRELYMGFVEAGELVMIDGADSIEEVSVEIFSAVCEFLEAMP